MSTFTEIATYQTVSCYKCHVAFALDRGHYHDLKQTRNDFWCPNGHPLHFIGETEAERLQRELEAEKARTEYAQRLANDRRDERIRVEHQLRAVKGHQTRLKKRIGAGVCPCCSRSFENLARHMAGQHPDFSGEASHD